MADHSIDVYLNDHLAGAMLGSNLAKQLRTQNHGTPLGLLMQSLAIEIEQDRQTLMELMQHMDISKSPVKQATAWIAEKASGAKFSGVTSGNREFGTFMALETLALGVRGKACMWEALKRVADQHPAIASVNLDELIYRASLQVDALDRERLASASRVLASQVSAAA